jgi:hypothetical protein
MLCYALVSPLRFSVSASLSRVAPLFSIAQQYDGTPEIGTVRVAFTEVPDGFGVSIAATATRLGGAWGAEEEEDIENAAALVETQGDESTPLKSGSGDDFESPKANKVSAKMGLGKIETKDESWFCPVPAYRMGDLWLMSRGVMTLKQLAAKKRNAENCGTWLVRAGGTCLLILGWTLLFSPIYTALEVLPFLGEIGYAIIFPIAIFFGLLCFCITCGVAYISYRPVLISLLLLGALAIVANIVYFTYTHQGDGIEGHDVNIHHN